MNLMQHFRTLSTLLEKEGFKLMFKIKFQHVMNLHLF